MNSIYKPNKQGRQRTAGLLTGIFLLIFMLLQPGCSSAPEPYYDEIIVIENFKDYAVLQIPDNEEYIVKYIDSDDLTVKVIRDLDFKGKSPDPELVKKIENNMSCAGSIKGRSFTLATYGEFTGDKGSGSIRLLIEVPLGILVEKAAKLHGPKSKAMKTDSKSGSDYQPAFSLNKGWKALSSTSLEGKDWTF